MFKKLSVCLLVILMLFGCGKKEEIEKQEDLTLHITVIDETKNITLLDKEITVSDQAIETLEDFLQYAPELETELSTGSYGAQIDGLMGLKTQNWSSGPWWVYESDNNESCVAMGMCDAISSLKVKEGDHFVFKFMDSF